MKTIVVLCCVLLVTSETSALATTDGTTWELWPEDRKLVYVAGVLDGWNFLDGLATLPSAQMSQTEQLNHQILVCLKIPELGQKFAIVQKYVTDNREDWHMEMATLIFRALLHECTKK